MVFSGYTFGKDGCFVREIRQTSGMGIVAKVAIVSGNDKQLAKVLVKLTIHRAIYVTLLAIQNNCFEDVLVPDGS